MPRIHDWRRVFWQNASGERVLNRTQDEDYDGEAEDFDEDVLAVYENSRGERVSYAYAPEESDAKYEVRLNGELVEDITLSGENFDDEEFEELTFETRNEAREAASDLQRMLAPIDEEMLEDDEDGYDYQELQELAKARGIQANQSADELRDALSS